MKPTLAAALAAGMLVVAAPARAQPPALETLRFMSGCWRGQPDARGTVIEEHYTPPSANLILGTTRYLRDGRAVSFEFARIDRTDQAVILTPMPNGRGSVAFTLVIDPAGRAVFENRTHDFPNRIIYRQAGDTLVARVEGNDGNGQEWRMTRAPCGG
jgi:hypothetical protein